MNEIGSGNGIGIETSGLPSYPNQHVEMGNETVDVYDRLKETLQKEEVVVVT